MTSNDKTSIKFCLFSDFHYWRGKYLNSLDDLDAILARAYASGASLVLQAGDLCQNRIESPELDDALLRNVYGLPVYGIYGNHDMEAHMRDGMNNMALITPLLTNDKDVVWGTPDGAPSPDGSIAYYYFEKNGFRFICLDSNYSWNPELCFWEHNRPGSWGAPAGNEHVHSLGPLQLVWLDTVLTDAAKRGLQCIIMSHEGFSTLGKRSPDADAVCAMYAKANGIRRDTVLMSINGHWHTHNIKIEDGVFYLQMNVTRCAAEDYLNREQPNHYPEDLMYNIFSGYGEDGRPQFSSVPVISAVRSASTWYFRDALSAIITVTHEGKITIDGMETDWLGGVHSPWQNAFQKPYIMSGEWQLDVKA